jgi:hypothetical protein
LLIQVVPRLWRWYSYADKTSSDIRVMVSSLIRHGCRKICVSVSFINSVPDTSDTS